MRATYVKLKSPNPKFPLFWRKTSYSTMRRISERLMTIMEQTEYLAVHLVMDIADMGTNIMKNVAR